MKDRVLRSRIRHEVIATMKTGEAWRGLHVEHDQRALVLQAPTQHDPEGKPVATADGQVVLLLADVAYLQYP